jgi:hypothetical protein
MRRGFLTAAPALLVWAFGASGAEAFVGTAGVATVGETISLVSPAAMCGYSCRSGGRYIPGPPSVCAENGMNFCGPSRPVGPPGVVRGGPYERERDWRDRRGGGGGGCRTVTIERDDGTITRIRRCD